MDNLKNSLVLLQPTPNDAKLCNYYVSGGTVVIETIAQYLARVPIKQRSAVALVAMLVPNEGYESLGTYSVADFKSTVLANFHGEYYTFQNGLADVNFTIIDIGKKIEMSIESGYFVWRYVGETLWINLIPVPTNGVDGAQGIPGERGSDILLADNYNTTAIGGILLCSQYKI